MRTINKKWSAIDAEDHVLLKWRDFEVKIDHDDFHLFEENILRIIYNKRKFTRRCAYLYIQHIIEKKYSYETFHRVILNVGKDRIVDHINGNTLDNRKVNLRLCNKGQNSANSKKMNRYGRMTSKYKGVSRTFRKTPWRTTVTLNGKVHSSYHSTEIEAAKKYNELALELFGEFAKINDIEE